MLNLSKKDILHRLKIARGHLEKVITMVASEQYCLSITQQSAAVQSALSKVDQLLLEHHLKTCMREAMTTDQNVEEKIHEIIETFKLKHK